MYNPPLPIGYNDSNEKLIYLSNICTFNTSNKKELYQQSTILLHDWWNTDYNN